MMMMIMMMMINGQGVSSKQDRAKELSGAGVSARHKDLCHPERSEGSRSRFSGRDAYCVQDSNSIETNLEQNKSIHTIALLTIPAGGLTAQAPTFEQNVCITMRQSESKENVRV